MADSSQGFQILPENLDAHARSIDDAAAALGTAAAAGLHTMLNPMAYGFLASRTPLPLLLTALQTLAVSAIEEQEKALRSVSELVHEVALRYQNHDESVDKMFSDLADQGGLVP
jgi:hypothetical protein